jgi:Flp pilus assembly protein TadD
MFSLAELRILLFGLLAAGLTLAAAPAFPAEPQSRAEALTQLRSPDAATRAEAIVWIANRGSMADAPLLQERLRDDSAFVRGFAEQGLWLLWSRSGDAQIDALMARGAEEIEAEHYPEAIALLTEVIRRRPEFAEGWNRRATVYYLAGEYAKSLADCDQVLRRNPEHFGALSGIGQIYTRLEEYDQALAWFRRALEVNPNMLGVELNMREIEEKLKAKRRRTT